MPSIQIPDLSASCTVYCKVNTIVFELHCSCVFAGVCESFELWSKCVKEVKVIVVTIVTAASHRASCRARPFKPVGVDDVVCVPAVLLCSQVG